MKALRAILFIFLIWSWNPGFSQYPGGNGDGYFLLSTGDITVNPQTVYCTGGSGDGHFTGTSGVMTPNSQSPYCTGGQGDGHNMTGSGSLTMNTQALYCTGGNADGHSVNGYSGVIYNSVIFCTGGDGDGYNHNGSGIMQINPQAGYCSGGNEDGYDHYSSAMLTPNAQNVYCTGGNADGHSHSLYSGFIYSAGVFCTGGNGDGHSYNLFAGQILNQSVYCTGGNGDGYNHNTMALTGLGSGIWKGTVSTDWSAAGNWINSTVPDATITVTIPAGCPYYPSLSGTFTINNASGSYKAKRLDILDGGSVTNTGALSVYGLMNISGMYVADNATSASQNIQSGGSLTITATGDVKIGNQSSGFGYCDLIVNSGGALTVSGGLLDIDDQLDILSGSTFNMTSGMVFAHRYGVGSLYSSSYPGSFYVASGASGSITGGVVKVAGKATVSSYYAVSVNSSSFDFTGSSSLVFTDGANITGDNVECRTVTGSTFQNMLIGRPERIVTIGSNATINGNVTVEHSSTLHIASGRIVTINGNLQLLP